MDGDKGDNTKDPVTPSAVDSGLASAVPAPLAPVTPASASGTSPATSSSRSGRSASLPASLRVSPQLNALCQRAATGASEDIKRLAQWSALVEHEAEILRKRLRKQQHDFATLFEIVGQTSARALDVAAMQNYLLRTVSGHFATPRLLIVRRLLAEDRELTCSAAQGVRDAKLSLAIDGQLCQFALERRFCFFLNEVPRTALDSPDAAGLKDLGLDLVVPLVQDVEAPGAVLEGLLLLGPRLSRQPFTEEDLEFLNILAKMLAICLRNEALYRRSIIDDLTGVASRGHFEAQLSQELNRIITYGHRSLGLVLLDIDHFKLVNDTHGHQSGDRVLQELSRLLVRQVRTVDLVARYGGEEFAVILLEIDRPKVLEVASRLRQAVEDLKIQSALGAELHITASFGLACFPDDATDRGMLIQLADEALYRSKSGGRNRVTMTEPGSGLNRSIGTLVRPVSVPLTGGALRVPSAAPAGTFGARGRPPGAGDDMTRLQQEREALFQAAPAATQHALPVPVPPTPTPSAPAAPTPPPRKRVGSERRRRKS
jgi:diguanylate cyclase (GGDEF)-like protein